MVKKNKRLEARRMKIFIFLIFGITLFMTAFTSAFEFDNVKTYDTQTKTATIENAFGLPNYLGGYEIVEIPLKSEQNVVLGLGYQEVFRYEINSLTEYKNFIQGQEIYNLKEGGTKEDKKIDLKLVTYEDIEVPDYKEVCSLNKNGTNECSSELTGTTHKEQREVFKDLTSYDVGIEKITISGWTDVRQGDYYEWIPKFAGVKVTEWATWSGNVSNGLMRAYTLDETTGTVVKDYGLDKVNGTIVNSVTQGVTGKLGTAYNLTEGSINISYLNSAAKNYTFSFWAKPNTNTTSGSYQFIFDSSPAARFVLQFMNSADSISFQDGAQKTFNIVPTRDLALYVITFSGTNASLYINGTYIASTTYTPRSINSTTVISGAVDDFTALRYYGILDEFYIWNRSISDLEIGYLWNNGDGCQVGNETCFGIPNNPPTITLNSPDDASTSNVYSNTFTCTGTDDVGISNISLYINGTYNQTNTSVFNNTATSFTTSLAEGYYNWSCKVWDNATTPQSATATIRTFNVSIGFPAVTLNSPVNAYNSTDKDMTFNCSVIDYYGVANVSLMLNGSINSTNTSGFNNTNYIFDVPLQDGFYNWSCNSKNINSKSTTVGYRNFTVNTVPIINMISPPVNVSNYTTRTIYINATSSLPVGSWIYNYNGTNVTLASINSSITTNADGNFNLLLYANNSDSGVYGLNNTIYFSIDSTLPTIQVTGGNGSLIYQNFSTNHTLNYTITDTNLNTCWIEYNSTNRTIPCTTGSANTTSFALKYGNYNATLWANDTFGNNNSRFVEWTYRLLFMNETFDASVLEGSTQPFTIFLITNGTDITVGNLSYNSIGYVGTVGQSGNNFSITRNVVVPSVTSDTIESFFWKITQSDGFVYNFSAKNQTVLNFGIDNCTTNTNVLYNFTILDEKAQTEVNETGSNSLAQINLQLYNFGTTTLIQSFNSQYNQTNPFAVCFNNTFADEKYSLDAQVRYLADTYEQEYYHIQNATVNNASFTTAINLYDLNTTDSQAFKLIYRDSSYLPVENALIVIGRKYVDEGAFKNVEIPKTDAYGETVAHLQVNNIIYNFTIIKNNIILGTFNNMFAVCQTPLVSECVIEFNSFAGAVTVPNFDDESDFTYTLIYTNTTRTVQSNFTLPSGTPATVLLRVEKSDALGTDICTDTLTSTSGTLSCVVPASIGNSTIIATLYKNGAYQGWGSLKINQTPTDIYGTSIMVFLSMIALLTLAGVALSGNPIITIAFLMVGVILMFALNLVASNGFIGATATILWILIAFILLLIKGVKR